MTNTVPCRNPAAHGVKSHIVGTAAAIDCARNVNFGGKVSSIPVGAPPLSSRARETEEVEVTHPAFNGASKKGGEFTVKFTFGPESGILLKEHDYEEIVKSVLGDGKDGVSVSVDNDQTVTVTAEVRNDGDIVDPYGMTNHLASQMEMWDNLEDFPDREEPDLTYEAEYSEPNEGQPLQDSVGNVKGAEEGLVNQARVNTTTDAARELLETEFGGEFDPKSLYIGRDGFTLKARASFIYRGLRFERGEIVAFDTEGNIQ